MANDLMLYEKEQTPPTTSFHLHSKFQQAASLGFLLDQGQVLFCSENTFLYRNPSLRTAAFPSPHWRIHCNSVSHCNFMQPRPLILCFVFLKLKGGLSGTGLKYLEVSLPARFVMFLQLIRTRASVCSKLYHVVINT